MSGNCSICLGTFVEPVSIPCGHVYCAECLAGHVNSSHAMDEIIATCPTCRSSFYTVTPDLTLLPKQYHRYVKPSVRRVFLDDSVSESLRRQLARCDARVKKLELERESLRAECELLNTTTEALASRVQDVMAHVQTVEAQCVKLDACASQLAHEASYWRGKYCRTKQRAQGPETLFCGSHDAEGNNTDEAGLANKRKSCTSKLRTLRSEETLWADSTGVEENAPSNAPLSGRKIKPIPRRSVRLASTHSQSDIDVQPKRQRVLDPKLRQ